MKLIADSGSTKTDWGLCDGREVVLAMKTQGMNPIHQDDETIAGIVGEVARALGDFDARRAADGRSRIADAPLEVCFYGAGCIPEQASRMQSLLAAALATTRSAVSVFSDLVAVCHAFCGHREGIACILGTGSNSCLYDGNRIVSNTPPMGYILGDEGSGAVLGRNFLNALFKGALPSEMKDEFLKQTGLTYPDIIQRVYREPMANRFLASCSPFIRDHIGDPRVRALVVDNFRAFLRTNVAPYRRTDLPVNVVGGLANTYRDQLAEAADGEGMKLGVIAKSPMLGLFEYWGCSL